MIHGETSGVYVVGRQKITGNATGGGITLFVNVVHIDPATNRIDKIINIGMLYKGLFPSRPHDQLGVAIGSAHVSARYDTAQRLQGHHGLSRQYMLEVNYKAQLYPGLWLMPNIQYVHNPGGNSDNDDVVVFGLQLAVTF